MNFITYLAILATAIIGTANASTYETIQDRPCFRSMNGMMDSMAHLASEHPNLVTIADIGDSFLKNNDGRHDGVHEIPDGGYDIYAINITAAESTRQTEEKGKMLLTSGVHAREWAPPELLARFIEMLVHGYSENADITWILQHTEIHAILYVNPDGRFMAEKYPELMWRKNMNPIHCGGGTDYGVDINRNLPFFWGSHGAGASSNPCASDYHGPSGPESEPETQALADYARMLFPVGQRKQYPEQQKDEPFGEGVTGIYVDIHASGGYVYYPWGHHDSQSPDDEALQALGRKINYFNDYKLWAGGQPDFVYPANGDTSDWAYGELGVASFGLEIGDSFQQNCQRFEDEVVPQNLPALIFAAKTVARPFSTIKGPDIMSVDVRHVNGEIRVSAHASDSEMVDAILELPDFRTGDQTITKVLLYLDVHPDDVNEGDASWEMEAADNMFHSEEETVGLALSARAHFTPGRHILYVQAEDSDGYKGPVSSVFVDVSDQEASVHGASLRGSRGQISSSP